MEGVLLTSNALSINDIASANKINQCIISSIRMIKNAMTSINAFVYYYKGM